jgi:hypothetical protein
MNDANPSTGGSLSTCGARSPKITQADLTRIGAFSEAYVGCALTKGHEGNHRGYLPENLRNEPEQDIWEWPNER